MESIGSFHSRREFLRCLAAGAGAFATAGLFAEELTRTPPQTEGPFYPNRLPLDTDNDLVVVNDTISAAVGEITHLTGRVMDLRGDPIRNALVEIWQVDANGAYIHSGSANGDKRDLSFQGFGRFLTGSTGEYYFRTIKPVPYPGRTPHIHFKIKMRTRPEFVTQCYIKGEARNESDGIYKQVARDPDAIRAVTVDFVPVKGSRIGELSARFDVVIGHTPEDAEAGHEETGRRRRRL